VIKKLGTLGLILFSLLVNPHLLNSTSNIVLQMLLHTKSSCCSHNLLR